MKTRLSIIITGFITLCFMVPAIEKNDLEKQRLKGKVKSVNEIKYTLSDKTSNAVKDKVIFEKLTSFNSIGYEDGIIIYESGEPSLKSTLTFRADGKPSERIETKADGSFNLRVSYVYDEKERIAEALYQWEEDREVGVIADYTDYFFDILKNEPYSKIKYTYEYRGFITEEKYLKEDGSTSFTFTNKYDPRGNKTESTYFHGNGRTSWVTKFKYDRYDNLIESNIIKDNRIVVYSTYTHQFDDAGNWIMRREERTVSVNIHTEHLEQANMVTERTIVYY